jgi:hypothetical protein
MPLSRAAALWESKNVSVKAQTKAINNIRAGMCAGMGLPFTAVTGLIGELQ